MPLPSESFDTVDVRAFLGGSETVFNIAGDKYRLVADRRYDLARVYVRPILGHTRVSASHAAGTLYCASHRRQSPGVQLFSASRRPSLAQVHGLRGRLGLSADLLPPPAEEFRGAQRA
jgi:hypothetical protein